MSLTDGFQSRGRREGAQVQEIARTVLEGAGFRITDRNVVAESGVTINYQALDRADQMWCFDVTGSFTSDRAGLRRTDTVWKALGRASVLSAGGFTNTVLLTTNLPERDSVGHRALQAASETYFDALEMLSANGKKRLAVYASGKLALPLPAFRDAAQIYPSLARSRRTDLTIASVAIDEIEQPLPELFEPIAKTELAYKIEVVVPSLDSAGEPIRAPERERVAHQLESELSGHAGGCTTLQALGSWIDPIGGVMHEEVHVVGAYAETPFPQELIDRAVVLILDSLNQHTAAVVVDHKMNLFSRGGVDGG